MIAPLLTPPWTVPGHQLAWWLTLGLAGGVAHFALLRWNTNLYLRGSLSRALMAQGFRMATTSLLLGFAAWHGAMPLLATTIGIFVARALVLRLSAVRP